jgi:hypothetical protein
VWISISILTYIVMSWYLINHRVSLVLYPRNYCFASTKKQWFELKHKKGYKLHNCLLLHIYFAKLVEAHVVTSL